MSVAAQRGVGSLPRARLACLLLPVLFGCGRSPVDECLDLLADGKEREAVHACQRAFELGGDPRAGLAAARALVAVGEPDRALERVAELEDSVEAAGALELAGRIHRERGEVEPALAAYERATGLYREAGEDHGAWRAAYTLFYVSWEEARYQDAFRWVWQSYEDAVRAGEPSLEAASLGGLATILFEVGDLAGTARVARAALEATPPQEGTNRARLLVLEGLVQLRSERPALARETFASALAAADAGAEPRFFRSGYLNQVDADLRLGDLEAAQTHLDAARAFLEEGRSEVSTSFYEARLLVAQRRFAEALSRLDNALAEGPDPGWRWNLLHLRGQAHEGLADWPAAERDYAAATETLEQLRRELGFDQLKAWLQDERRAPFEALVALQAEHGRAAHALQTVERAKARTLVDAMLGAARAGWRSNAGADDAAAAVERASALVRLLPSLTSSAAVEAPPLRDLLRLVGRRHVLEYFEAGDTVWLFTVTGEEIRSHRLASPATELAELAARLRATPDDEALAERLGGLLLPRGSLTPMDTRIEIVADGALGLVPFAALRREGRLLVEDHALTYVPSLHALASLLREERPTRGTIQVVGDPLGDLESAANEAEEVAAMLGGHALVGPVAMLERLPDAATVQLLHLATHTGLGPAGPWLALADGEVDAAAILAGRLGGDVVVLASCASAAREGKGLWGSVAAAFLAAGSRAVVASLWSVEDRAATRLVRLFYEHGGASDPAMGLARSQRRLVARGEPASAWAGFVVFGLNEPIVLD